MRGAGLRWTEGERRRAASRPHSAGPPAQRLGGLCLRRTWYGLRGDRNWAMEATASSRELSQSGSVRTRPLSHFWHSLSQLLRQGGGQGGRQGARRRA